MIRPGGMSSDEDSDWDDDFYSLGPTKKAEVPVPKQISLEEELIQSVTYRELDRIKDLLEKGADVNFCPHNNWNAIIQACSIGVSDIVQLLVDHGADVNSSHEKFTPLLGVCSSTSRDESSLLRCLEILLDNGAKINVSDWYRMSALSHAVRRDHEGLVAKLINEGVDLSATDQDGWTALHYAVDSGNASIVNLLVSAGCNIYDIDRNGRSLLDIALEKEHQHIVTILSGGVDCKEWLFSLNSLETETNTYHRISSALPLPTDRLSGFKQDVLNMLNAVQLTHLCDLFYHNKIGLGHLLTLDDRMLKNLEVQFCFERKKILYTVQKFHEYPWSMSSFGYVVNQKELDLFHVSQLLATLTRQLYLISVASYHWSHLGGCSTEDELVCNTLTESLRTIKLLRGKIYLLQKLVRNISKKDSIVPSDLITPAKSHNYCKFYVKTSLFSGCIFGVSFYFVKNFLLS